jgi:hypothetical protein
MVQLTLHGIDDRETLASLVSRLSQDSALRLGESAHVAAATRVTSQRFGTWGSRVLTAHDRDRVTAYYRAVLRNRVLRMRDEEAARARQGIILASIEADLLSAGWDTCRASEEALRAVGAGPLARGAA